MMHGGYHFFGMHLFWWLFWILFIFILFGIFKPVPKSRAKEDSPLDILKKRLASGEITTEEYQEKKRLIEQDSSMKN